MTGLTATQGSTPFPIVSVRGAPRDRGRRYGAAARSQISLAVDVYRRRFSESRGLSWNEVTAIARRFRDIIADFDAELVDEMAGIAEGAGRPLEDIVALNVRTELLGGVRAECTSVAVIPPATANQHTLFAANWDYYPELAPACLLLAVVQPGRPSQLMFVEAGMIAKMGLNSAGLGVCQNGLRLGVPRLGVPYYAVLRRAQDAESVDEAISRIVEARRSFSANFLIAHASGDAADVEAAPTDHAVLRPQRGALCHANHCLAPILQPLDAGVRWLPDSSIRVERAQAQLRAVEGNVDVQALQNLLRDHENWPDAICRHLNERQPASERMRTIASFVVDLTDQVAYITNGPPCENPYYRLSLSDAIDAAAPRVTRQRGGS